MSAGIINIYSNLVLVQKMWNLLLFRLIEWPISWGCQVYALVVNTILENFLSYDKLCVTNMIFIFVTLLCLLCENESYFRKKCKNF